MQRNYYKVSRETLELLAFHVSELVLISYGITKEYKNSSNSLKSEIITDEASFQTTEHSNQIYKLLNIICNNDKISRGDMIEGLWN